MHHHVRLSTWLAILAVLVSGLDAKALYHRIYHPTLAPDAQFSLRGTLDHGDVANAPSLQTDLLSFSKFISQLDTTEKLNGALYQLAFERESDPSPEDWIISSVKACHLPTASSDSIFLHLAANGEPSAINYFLSPLPLNGGCSFTTKAEARVVPSIAFPNTTLRVQQPRLPPLPELRSPPPLTPEGKVVVPEPEKSFIQKYWVYALAFVVILAMAPAPPEEEGGAGPGGPGRGGK